MFFIFDLVFYLGMYLKDIIREEGKDVCIRLLIEVLFLKNWK